ncbi:MAG TPA: gliding motility-associated C-terminal domain-containing protein [Cyclobacteriaceae bacterium]
MRGFFVGLLCVFCLQAGASHIVGGEFELLHISDSTYRLNLILYFDVLNGNPGAKDQVVTAAFFRKSDNTFISNLILPLISENNVSYTQPECSNGEIVTNKIIYTTTVILSPSVFNEEEGYYVVWERCCRNYSITNIFSEDPGPQSGGLSAGQTFLLEFPPVVKKGQPFINSSPRLFPPLNDYACPGKPYYVDFAGVDDDGDSLVYSLTTPLNTHDGRALPPAMPMPYPLVEWRPGFDLQHIINGNPDLKISNAGLLTATPLIQGLFVFAVKVEEYRNKELIGISRRDFQMLVVDGCADAVPPQITGPTSITLTSVDVGDDRCITVTVSDEDSKKLSDNFVERIKLRAIGLNFNNKNLTDILPPVVEATLVNGSTHDYQICFPVCPYFIGGPYEVGIIAMDDACSLPLLDTLKVTVDVQIPPNTDPYFSTGPATYVLNEGESTPVIPFVVEDADIKPTGKDELLVSVITDGFVLKDSGFTYEIDSQVPGRVEGHLKWNAFCDIYDFTQRSSFKITLQVDDLDECSFNDPVKQDYNFTVILPTTNPPVIDTDLTPEFSERVVLNVQRKIFENLSFNVVGQDLVDNDFLKLKLIGSNLLSADSLRGLGVTFGDVDGNGSVQSQFNWDFSCDNLDLDNLDSFDLQFIVVDDKNKCGIYKADTLEVELKVNPPDNAKPQLTVNNLNASFAMVSNRIETVRGNQIALELQGTDSNTNPKDLIKLNLIKIEGNVEPSGFVFAPVEGEGSVATTFSWNPDCSIFENDIYENDYKFTFRLSDDRCYSEEADTLVVEINIKDIDIGNAGFTPINYFTPNDDGFNDYYAMELRNFETGELENILPHDNCISSFQVIRVYNRWGKEVFQSKDRDFKWFGKDEPAGVYYYVIEFSDREYKGALSIRY